MGARFDTIRTKRLVMRRWRDSDREPYAALNADPVVMRYFPATHDRTASDDHIDRMETLFEVQGFGLWALELAGTSQFLGFTGLNPMPEGVPGAGGMEVGWRLAQHAWHHGYATEAATAALGVAFDGLGLEEVWSMTAVLNEPSQAVMKRLGMSLYARFEHPRIEAGHPIRPHVAYRRLNPRPAGDRGSRVRSSRHPFAAYSGPVPAYQAPATGGQMDPEEARRRLLAERAEVTDLLSDTEEAGQQDREAEDARPADYGDAAQPLAAEAQDDAIAESLRDRLDQITRALRRLDNGTYGLSVRSGEPIPDARLEADPAAELTVEEAAAEEAAER